MMNYHDGVDILKLFFEEPITIRCGEKDLVLYQPSIGDIMELGESEIYSTIYIFAGNPTSYRVELWDNGIDWNKISDFELFSLLIKGLKIDRDEETGEIIKNPTDFLFKDQCDFSRFELYSLTDEEGNETKVLYNEEQDLLIDEESYMLIANNIRTMFGITPKVEKAKGKLTKETIINQEKSYRENKKEESSSMLVNLISFCLNHPGFKYKKKELKDVGIFEFMDSVNRLQIYESTSALLRGSYSGFCDTSKIDKKNFDFMRDLYSTNS